MTALQIDTVVRQIVRTTVVVDIPGPPELPAKERLASPFSICKNGRLKRALLSGWQPADGPGPLAIALSTGTLRLSISRVLT